MTRLGFHASHEQISPRQLLTDVKAAEQAGFDMAMCSDHFQPWSSRQGHAGYAWSWLGAALATTGLEFGCVCAPGQRYHPAIVAQKLATLAQMFPGRIWTALGSGEAINEVVTGEVWPRKELRVRRLEECVDVIRRLLRGEEVSSEGLVTVDRARVWEVPEQQPLLLAPVVSTESARRVARWADGLITVNQEVSMLRDIVDHYRDAGGRGRLALQLHLSWGASQAEAEAIAFDQWRSNVFSAAITWDTPTVAGFDAASEHVTLESVHSSVRISADVEQHSAWIKEYAELGFDDIYLHFVGQDQSRFIEEFGTRVLPVCR